MALTVAGIARAALNAAGAAVSDAVHPATLTYTTNGAAYYPELGGYATTEHTLTGRAVADQTRPVADIFPDYVAGPADVLILLEGFSAAPEEGWKLTFAGKTRTIMRVQDIAAAGSAFYVVAR